MDQILKEIQKCLSFLSKISISVYYFAYQNTTYLDIFGLPFQQYYVFVYNILFIYTKLSTENIKKQIVNLTKELLTNSFP